MIPHATDAEGRIFYFKMKGDYQRYQAEYTTGQAHQVATETALLAYKAAMEIATADIAPSHPIRLGLALNFSVFYYEILQSPERACELAKQVSPA